MKMAIRQFSIISILFVTPSCMSYFEAHAGVSKAHQDRFEFWLLSETSLLDGINLQFRLYSDELIDEHLEFADEIFAQAPDGHERTTLQKLEANWIAQGKPANFEHGPPFEYAVIVKRSTLNEFPPDKPVKACVIFAGKPFFTSRRSQDIWLLPPSPTRDAISISTPADGS